MVVWCIECSLSDCKMDSDMEMEYSILLPARWCRDQTFTTQSIFSTVMYGMVFLPLFCSCIFLNLGTVDKPTVDDMDHDDIVSPPTGKQLKECGLFQGKWVTIESLQRELILQGEEIYLRPQDYFRIRNDYDR